VLLNRSCVASCPTHYTNVGGVCTGNFDPLLDNIYHFSLISKSKIVYVLKVHSNEEIQFINLIHQKVKIYLIHIIFIYNYINTVY